jgi:beta-glucan synthesis-associated protein KRE6
MNLGMSPSFAPDMDISKLTFPATMLVDYIRVYQPRNAHNVGCDPKDRPTMSYIKTYSEAYTNTNLTRWGSPQFNQSEPKNRLNGGC